MGFQDYNATRLIFDLVDSCQSRIVLQSTASPLCQSAVFSGQLGFDLRLASADTAAAAAKQYVCPDDLALTRQSVYFNDVLYRHGGDLFRVAHVLSGAAQSSFRTAPTREQQECMV